MLTETSFLSKTNFLDISKSICSISTFCGGVITLGGGLVLVGVYFPPAAHLYKSIVASFASPWVAGSAITGGFILFCVSGTITAIAFLKTEHTESIPQPAPSLFAIPDNNPELDRLNRENRELATNLEEQEKRCLASEEETKALSDKVRDLSSEISQLQSHEKELLAQSECLKYENAGLLSKIASLPVQGQENAENSKPPEAPSGPPPPPPPGPPPPPVDISPRPLKIIKKGQIVEIKTVQQATYSVDELEKAISKHGERVASGQARISPQGNVSPPGAKTTPQLKSQSLRRPRPMNSPSPNTSNSLVMPLRQTTPPNGQPRKTQSAIIRRRTLQDVPISYLNDDSKENKVPQSQTN